MFSEEKVKMLKDRGFSDDKIKEFEQSSEKMRLLAERAEQRSLLPKEEREKQFEARQKRARDMNIERWKQYKYNNVWPFSSIDNMEFIKTAQKEPYLAVYNYFRKLIGDDIDDL